MELKEKTRGEIETIVQNAIDDAVDFVESEISEDRIRSQRYYDGEVDIGYEDGRSKVVATKVRDTVRAIKPSLMRVFLSTAKPQRVYAAYFRRCEYGRASHRLCAL